MRSLARARWAARAARPATDVPVEPLGGLPTPPAAPVPTEGNVGAEAPCASPAAQPTSHTEPAQEERPAAPPCPPEFAPRKAGIWGVDPFGRRIRVGSIEVYPCSLEDGKVVWVDDKGQEHVPDADPLWRPAPGDAPNPLATGGYGPPRSEFEAGTDPRRQSFVDEVPRRSPFADEVL